MIGQGEVLAIHGDSTVDFMPMRIVQKMRIILQSNTKVTLVPSSNLVWKAKIQIGEILPWCSAYLYLAEIHASEEKKDEYYHDVYE
ncbi:hypothetical protein M5K25_025544 [Dendrobium thyrsiflorum]|uniref:Uncharacterized protein n=1 Tax=Dendrobium thyrsiflorum TaxID=117978 RepID=A0ABD0U4G1_DENTH